MSVIVIIMFIILGTDRYCADSVMLATLTLCMAANIITIKEGVAGFANEGILTVMI